jgi:hypothetical protein
MTQGINSLGSGAENPIQIWFSSYWPIPELVVNFQLTLDLVLFLPQKSWFWFHT